MRSTCWIWDDKAERQTRKWYRRKILLHFLECLLAGFLSSHQPTYGVQVEGQSSARAPRHGHDTGYGFWTHFSCFLCLYIYTIQGHDFTPIHRRILISQIFYYHRNKILSLLFSNTSRLVILLNWSSLPNNCQWTKFELSLFNNISTITPLILYIF